MTETMPGQVADQARRLVALEEALKEARLRPMARRRCLEGEDDPVSALERQLSSVTQELEVGPLHPYGRSFGAVPPLQEQ